MARDRIKSQYKHVSGIQDRSGNVTWIMNLNVGWKEFESEREAAKAADIILIKRGKKPVNILTKQT